MRALTDKQFVALVRQGTLFVMCDDPEIVQWEEAVASLRRDGLIVLRDNPSPFAGLFEPQLLRETTLRGFVAARAHAAYLASIAEVA